MKERINRMELVPFAVFVCIVVWLFIPLSYISDTASLPCILLAKSFCTFFVGCHIAEFTTIKISRWLLLAISIIGLICFISIPVIDGLATYWVIDPCCILGVPVKYVRWTAMNPFFICLGFILNCKHSEIKYFEYSARMIGNVKKDIIMAILTVFAYVTMIYCIHIPAFFEGLPNQTVWTIRFIVRIISLVPLTAVMLYLYRILTSKLAYSITDRYPKVFRFIAAIAPAVVFLLLFAHIFSYHYWYRGIIFKIIVAYILTVTFRLSVQLLKTMLCKDFGWKKILFGNID